MQIDYQHPGLISTVLIPRNKVHILKNVKAAVDESVNTSWKLIWTQWSLENISTDSMLVVLAS